MKTRINKNKCMGCGICVDVCSKGIKMIESKATIKNENADCLKDAAESCPAQAIILNKEEPKKKDNSTILNQNFNKVIRQDTKKGFGQRKGTGAGRGKGLRIGPKNGGGKARGGGRRKL